ncbi:DUF276 domain-containing protein [Borrelia puertoricensis]|uniref:DUF276 domain-containing protein n=1 Tax=Borrelia puertoricensis TaxID=2756107 RepID=UPI001FF6AE3C|nr:DUF276 domain-containing protein [Borrelia puertoricensis]
MSILFDPDFGTLKQDIQQIINTKREYLKDMFGITFNNDPTQFSVSLCYCTNKIKKYEMIFKDYLFLNKLHQIDLKNKNIKH